MELPGVGRQEGRASHHVCWRPPRAARRAAGMRYPLEPVVTRDSVQEDEIKRDSLGTKLSYEGTTNRQQEDQPSTKRTNTKAMSSRRPLDTDQSWEKQDGATSVHSPGGTRLQWQSGCPATA